MAKYSKWAYIAKTVVNGLNWQKCTKTNKNYQLKTKKKQAETGRNKNNRQKLSRIMKNWQNGQKHAKICKNGQKIRKKGKKANSQFRQKISQRGKNRHAICLNYICLSYI